MTGTFVLELHDLDAAGKTLREPVPLAWLRGALEDTEVLAHGEDGLVDVRFSKTGTDVVVRGTVKATLQTPCSRCLEPAVFEADGEISLLLVPEASPRGPGAKGKAPPKPPRHAHDEVEITAADAELDTYSGEQVILDPFLREALLLEVPPFPLCKPDCQGIAPPPGNEDVSPEAPIDPRLLPLLALKNQVKRQKD